MELPQGFETAGSLIGYCEIHCKTERALFKGTQINAMIELAGFPEEFPKELNPDLFIPVYEEMETLCKLARQRLGEDSGEDNKVKPNLSIVR